MLKFRSITGLRRELLKAIGNKSISKIPHSLRSVNLSKVKQSTTSNQRGLQIFIDHKEIKTSNVYKKDERYIVGNSNDSPITVRNHDEGATP